MARSPEYPDLAWVEPRSWTNANRSEVQLVVIHTTEGSARGTSAEDGAAYDQRRADGTSTHYFHDNDSTIQCVRTADQAHAARTQGNRRGIQHELCTRADSANWADVYHTAMLRLVAKQAARDATKWDIPVRHLTVDQVAAGAKGFCGHVDVTKAFPADGGTHTDPGKDFPWTRFLDMVRAELEDDDVSSADVIAALTSPAGQKAVTDAFLAGWTRNQGNTGVSPATMLWRSYAGGDDVDEAEIIAGVLAGLSPALIAAAIPKELAAQVADELRARLES